MTSPPISHEDKCNLWSSKNESIFIRLLHDHVLKGDLKTSTFDKKTWSTIKSELFSEINHHFTIGQLKSKYNRLKKKHREFSQLISKTGFGWNSNTNTIKASEAVWEEYLKTNPSAKQFRQRGLDHYDMLGVIFNNTTATGAVRFSSRQMPSKLEDEQDLDENIRDYGLHDGGSEYDDVADDDEYEDDDDNIMDPLPRRGRGKRPRRGCSKSSELPPRKNKENMDNFTAAVSEYMHCKNSQASMTTQAPIPKDPLDECMARISSMEGIPSDLYFKFCTIIVEQPDWRRCWLGMPDDRKREWIFRL